MSEGASLKVAQAAKLKACEVFESLVGEVAVGLVPMGKGLYGLKVNLTTAPDESISLPHEIQGVPVQVEVVGKIRKL